MKQPTYSIYSNRFYTTILHLKEILGEAPLTNQGHQLSHLLYHVHDTLLVEVEQDPVRSNLISSPEWFI